MQENMIAMPFGVYASHSAIKIGCGDTAAAQGFALCFQAVFPGTMVVRSYKYAWMGLGIAIGASAVTLFLIFKIVCFGIIDAYNGWSVWLVHKVATIADGWFTSTPGDSESWSWY